MSASPHEPGPLGASSIPQTSPTNYVQEFYDHSLIELTPHASHIQSMETRSPACFDRHLPDHLRLQKVVYLPEFVVELEGLAEAALTRYIAQKGALPTNIESFPNPDELLEDPSVSITTTIVDEESLVKAYEYLIPGHCVIVAATLEFQQNTWRNHGLKWSTKYSRDRQTQAIADGFLQLGDTPTDLPETLLDEYRQMIKNFPVMGVWEFKSLKAGSLDVMEAFLTLCSQDRFPWIGCKHGKNCALKCNKSPESSSKPLVSWARMGHSAVTPVCWSPPGPPPVSDKLHDKHLKHVIYMAQQVFAEMVLNDTTYGCLSSGRYDIFLRRDRATGQMGISAIVDSACRGYARKLVGLFIAMIQDARQRSKRLEAGHPPTWIREDFEVAQVDNRPAVEIQKDILKEMRERNLLIILPNRKIPAVEAGNSLFLPRSHYIRLYPLPVRADQDFIRVSANPRCRVSKAIITIGKEQFTGLRDFRPTVYLKHSGAGSKADTYAAHNEVKTYDYLSKHSPETRAVIPELIGFFGHANNENVTDQLPYATLMLEDVGSSVVQCKQVTKDLRIQCERALRAVHAAGVIHHGVGLDHFIIRDSESAGTKNIVSIISWAFAEHVGFGPTAQIAKEREIQELAQAFDRLEASKKESAKHSRMDDQTSIMYRKICKDLASYDGIVLQWQRLDSVFVDWEG